jgi:small subunit ribosomal protein S16
MLAIKLQRIGKKHQPSYRIVIAEKRSKLNGRPVEDIGWWNPRSKEHGIEKERANHWISKGAKPTDTVWNLLVTAGVLTGAKRANFKLPKKAAAGTEKSAA